MALAQEYVETRDGGYYVSGTRIGLDVLVYEFRQGRSPEAIFEAYPSMGSLAKVYGAITFVLEHPAEIATYLGEQDRVFAQLQASHPLADSMVERFERGKRDAEARR